MTPHQKHFPEKSRNPGLPTHNKIPTSPSDWWQKILSQNPYGQGTAWRGEIPQPTQHKKTEGGRFPIKRTTIVQMALPKIHRYSYDGNFPKEPAQTPRNADGPPSQTLSRSRYTSSGTQTHHDELLSTRNSAHDAPYRCRHE